LPSPNLAQAQAQLAAAMASGNPAAIAASKQSLHMLSMKSLNNLNGYGADPLLGNEEVQRLHEQVDKFKGEKKHFELSLKDLERERDELLRDVKSLKGNI
jgi:hypothetical protein